MRLFICVLFLISWLYKGFSQSISEDASIITFEVSNMKFRTVKGTFKGMKGKLQFDPNNVEKAHFNVCIDAATVHTNNKKRDKHLREEDFFNVEKYPTICFKSKSVSKTTDAYITKGTLTMHGVSKEVEIPFTYENELFKGNFKVKRLDYGIGGKGGFMVGKEINIDLLCKVVHKKNETFLK
jgi:polyisoprenoid-binding protein YceI